MSGTILILAERAAARDGIRAILEPAGYRVDAIDPGHVASLVGTDWDVAIVDLDGDSAAGLQTLHEGCRRLPATIFVVTTPTTEIDRAVEALKTGADSFLPIPLREDALLAVVERGVERSRLQREAKRLRSHLTEPQRIASLVGDHPAMQEVLTRLRQVAKTRATVLISGESGTGKELLASAIHHHSPRRDGPLVRLSCAALNETLLESELFGHERGAFTGAHERRRGRFEQADGGTLFLDEVSEIPLPVQVKLLRFLQERTFERVGGNEPIPVDVRVVAATNKALDQLVEDGVFRQDLYYRLQVVELEMPPLRARPTDIPLLAHHFLRRFAEENEVEITGFDDNAMRALLAYPWPGNVRELENAIERAVVLCADEVIGLKHLPTQLEAEKVGGIRMFVPGVTLEELERMAILRTLEATGGDTQKAADLLGVSRRKIQYRLKEWEATDH